MNAWKSVLMALGPLVVFVAFSVWVALLYSHLAERLTP